VLDWAVTGERANFEQCGGSPNCKFPSLCVILLQHDVLFLDEPFACQSVESNEDLQPSTADGGEHAEELEIPHAQ
jgi:hypothetical protein